MSIATSPRLTTNAGATLPNVSGCTLTGSNAPTYSQITPLRGAGAGPKLSKGPQGTLIEYLRLGPHGAIGPIRSCSSEAGPMDSRRDLYRTDADSQFTARMLTMPGTNWNTALVTFEGERRILLWTSDWYGCNGRATTLLHQSTTERLTGRALQPGEEARGDAYLVLNCFRKPVANIVTPIRTSREFRKEANPLFQGWWHAIQTGNGWRLFADDEDELLFAKLRL
jgi:hypothetical protein